MLFDNINDMTEWFTEQKHKTTQEVLGKRTLYRNDNGFNAAPYNSVIKEEMPTQEDAEQTKKNAKTAMKKDIGPKDESIDRPTENQTKQPQDAFSNSPLMHPVTHGN